MFQMNGTGQNKQRKPHLEYQVPTGFPYMDKMLEKILRISFLPLNF